MPIDPSQGFLQQFGIQQPRVPTGNNLPGIAGPMPVAQPLLPSWMRSGFEGINDATMGALGVGGGPNASTMNQVGQLGVAALPFMGGIRKLLGLGEAAGPMSRFAQGGDLAIEPKPPINPMDRFSPTGDLYGSGQKPILDASGRVLGYESKQIPTNAPRPPGPWDMNQAPTKPQGYAPNVDQLEELLKKYKK